MHLCVYIYIIYTCVCIYVSMYLYMYLCIYVSMYVYIHLSIYLSIHPSIHSSIHPSIPPYGCWTPFLSHESPKKWKPAIHLELLGQRLHWPLRGIFLQPRGECSHVMCLGPWMAREPHVFKENEDKQDQPWLVGGFNPSEKVGMILPNIQKIKNVPNHKPPARWTPNHDHHGFWPQKSNKPSRQLPRPFETSVTPRCCSL